MNIQNASRKPEVYYGQHFAPGVAEYREPGKEPYRIFINSETIRDMDPTFVGRPVYVFHKEDEVDWSNIQQEADGFVIESFYNAADGHHWVKFIVVSDKGHEAVAKGWKLSNAYHVKSSKGAGIWHGVNYVKEVSAGEYDHLAIVPNPRYESKVLTPEQFKSYNAEKELKLEKLANSDDDQGEPMFFKKQKVENSKELEEMSVTLPKSKKEVSVAELIANADSNMMSGCYANGEHKVKVGDEEMTVNELVSKHLEMKNKMGGDEADKAAKEDPGAEHPAEEMAANDEDEEAKKKALELAKHEEKEIAEKKKNSDEENFKKLKNAPANQEEVVYVDTSMDRVARGKTRYGSN